MLSPDNSIQATAGGDISVTDVDEVQAGPLQLRAADVHMDLVSADVHMDLVSTDVHIDIVSAAVRKDILSAVVP